MSTLYKDPTGVCGYIEGNAEYGTWTEVDARADAPTHCAPIRYQHRQTGSVQIVKLGLFPSPSDLDAGELGPIGAVIELKTGNSGYAPDVTIIRHIYITVGTVFGASYIKIDSVFKERLMAAGRGIAERFFNRDKWWDGFTKNWSAAKWARYEHGEATE